MAINLTSPAGFTSAVLIADTVATSGGSSDSVSAMTKVGGVAVSAALEIQSTLGGLLLPRMTTAQIAAIVTPTAGMQVFNTTTNAVNVYQNAGWSVGLLQSITGTLTLAQFLATNSAPITLLAAPGAGLMYLVNQFTLQDVYGSAQLAGGGAVALYYAVAGPTYVIGTNTIAAAALQAVTANTLFGLTSAIVNTGVASANTANASLVLRNPTADFTVGTGATFRYNLIYTIVPST